MSDLRKPKPYLLLDVDGVLCPLWEQPGYEFMADLGVWVSGVNRDALVKLQDHFELIWATLWEEMANEGLAGLHGLDPLPYIVFELEFGTYSTLKLPSVIEFVEDRPFAWIDDDIFWDAEEYAANREIPTFIIKTDPHVGITADHVEQLIDFAESIQ